MLLCSAASNSKSLWQIAAVWNPACCDNILHTVHLYICRHFIEIICFCFQQKTASTTIQKQVSAVPISCYQQRTIVNHEAEVTRWAPPTNPQNESGCCRIDVTLWLCIAQVQFFNEDIILCVSTRAQFHAGWTAGVSGSNVCIVPSFYNSTRTYRTLQRKHRKGAAAIELCYGCLLFSFFPEPQASGRHQGHLGATLLKYEMRGQWRDGPAHDILLLALSSAASAHSLRLWWLRSESLFH